MWRAADACLKARAHMAIRDLDKIPVRECKATAPRLAAICARATSK
ncbi:hypothetical protein CBM2598_U10228 [Cupriavidus taiwanensis]|nr:hypothetical protein CBM2598_U10228 [Cupriavidus taiwanensis]